MEVLAILAGLITRYFLKKTESVSAAVSMKSPVKDLMSEKMIEKSITNVLGKPMVALAVIRFVDKSYLPAPFRKVSMV
jgi:hypothetical protein